MRPLVEEAAAASQQLLTQANELGKLAGAFTLEDAGQDRARSHGLVAAPSVSTVPALA
ncbi:hypothetical protein [Massilia sp. ST3]|uniref:hypothetical protein n=1 Tax=Massilia sp. ST3 TaxID=2824903 RepID=UPI001B819EDC|nr:hypothetical protein [Massilia sp. ST3]MBQ5949313.1 hypothetical protein [Massilia sp. ST3]